MPDDVKEAHTYRFGPLERRGLVGGLQPSQVACVAAAAAGAVAALRLAPNSAGFAFALLAVAAGALVAFAPISGRPPIAWLPVMATWLSRPRGYRSSAPASGITVRLDGADAKRPIDLPGWLERCELAPVSVGDQDVGVLKDARHGSLTAAVAVRVRAVGLLPTAEHEARLARWGELLAGLARSRSPIRRLQILQRALPADADELWRHFFDARDSSIEPGSTLDRSYRALLDDARQVTQDREILLAVQIDARRAWSHDARARQLTREQQAELVLLRELRGLVTRFQPLDAEIAGVLTAEQFATAIRNAYDPFRRTRMNDTAPDGVPGPLDFAPTASEARWRSFNVDGAVHRTYWIGQWPRLPVGPLFLTPLLLGAHAVHSVSVVIEPIPSDRARRGAEAAITSDAADEELRERRGFRTSAVKRRQQQAAVRREEELASGHEEVRFAGYVTVTGRFEAELEEACNRVEHGAEQARLDLRPLWGEQDAGFVHGALPLARGLLSNRGLL
jgi:hypothetical protein